MSATSVFSAIFPFSWLPSLFYALCLGFYIWDFWHAPDRSPHEEDERPPGEEKFLSFATIVFLTWWIAWFLPFFLKPTPWLQHWGVQVVGLFVMIGGIVLRQTAIRTLDRHFTYQLCLRPDHQIIRKGVYRLLRHPSYTGTLLEMTGLLLVGRNAIALGLFGVSAALLFAWRIQREEALLQARFGEEYREYMRTTWRLIPWLFGWSIGLLVLPKALFYP
ncbi:MAG: isoprenylcysteine carboxylmethyltransferase family protein [Myxococcales bacterium]|nr:isoprenylcysteine carboxylmethyltransferase family protein [Myxococcales bacterium]